MSGPPRPVRCTQRAQQRAEVWGSNSLGGACLGPWQGLHDRGPPSQHAGGCLRMYCQSRQARQQPPAPAQQQPCLVEHQAASGARGVGPHLAVGADAVVQRVGRAGVEVAVGAAQHIHARGAHGGRAGRLAARHILRLHGRGRRVGRHRLSRQAAAQAAGCSVTGRAAGAPPAARLDTHTTAGLMCKQALDPA